MRLKYLTTLAVVLAVIISVGFYGCKKEEPQEEELLKQTKIAFASERDGNSEIYIMNVDGSGLENLTNNPAWDKYPS